MLETAVGRYDSVKNMEGVIEQKQSMAGQEKAKSMNVEIGGGIHVMWLLKIYFIY